MSVVITLDGPAASGKGTLAGRLAETLGFACLDTGLLYRATGFYTLQRGGDPYQAADATVTARSLDTVRMMTDPDLRGAEAGNLASVVGAMPDVRAALLDFQRVFAAHPPGDTAGAVLDGRDTGTVVCPDALLKFYITATPEARAERRHRDLVARGQDISFDKVLADIRERDARDMNRATAPLKPAPDAVIIDTTHLDIEQAFATVLSTTRERLKLA